MSSAAADAPLSGAALMRAVKEIRQLEANPPEGIVVHLSEDTPSQLVFDLAGPVDTPFEGGVFRVRLQLSGDYPTTAPKGWFLTKIFHPNMNGKTGEICLSTLKKDWQPKLGLRHVCLSIRCLLIEPNPASALNEDAAKLLLDNYADYAQRARIMTKIHAKPMQQAAEAEAQAADSEGAPASASTAAAAGPSEQENHGGHSAAAPVSTASKTPLTQSSSAINPSVAGVSAAPVATKPAPVAAPSAAAAAAAEKAKAAAALKKKAAKRL